MTGICLYFQVHQPYRIREFSFFNIGKGSAYFNDELNETIFKKVAEKCYLPAGELLLSLVKKHGHKLKINFSLSGTFISQAKEYTPEVLAVFKQLAETGSVEFLAETYYHSLAFLYDRDEFDRQVTMHDAAIQEEFGLIPKVFRNTELIYNNELAAHVQAMGYKGIVAEGVTHILKNRSVNQVFSAAETKGLPVLLRDYRLSDDIAFRFTEKKERESTSELIDQTETQTTEPDVIALTASEFLLKLDTIPANRFTGLFMDYETFGEHQWKDKGIFQFLKEFPEKVLESSRYRFLSASESATELPGREVFDTKDFISWADTERDLSAWLGNSMQHESLKRIYQAGKDIARLNDPVLLETWSRLQSSDHFYYMSTKHWTDGEVHAYFSPFTSPYDAYIYYMNVMADLELEINKKLKARFGIK